MHAAALLGEAAARTAGNALTAFRLFSCVDCVAHAWRRAPPPLPNPLSSSTPPPPPPSCQQQQDVVLDAGAVEFVDARQPNEELDPQQQQQQRERQQWPAQEQQQQSQQPPEAAAAGNDGAFEPLSAM